MEEASGAEHGLLRSRSSSFVVANRSDFIDGRSPLRRCHDMRSELPNQLESIVQRRHAFIADLERGIVDIDRFQRLMPVLLLPFSVDKQGLIQFPLCFGGQRLALNNGDNVLLASTFDDLIEQLDEIKTITGFGGLDDALGRVAK